MCVFCNLAQESHEHLFHECCKTQGVWDLISTATGKNIFFPAGFVSGNWISLTSYSMRAKVLIAFAACFFGTRCDAIFRNIRPNFFCHCN